MLQGTKQRANSSLMEREIKQDWNHTRLDARASAKYEIKQGSKIQRIDDQSFLKGLKNPRSML